jgi:hypothetical protein
MDLAWTSLFPSCSPRRFVTRIAKAENVRLIRINPRDPDVPGNEVSIPLGTLEALRQIDDGVKL